MGACVATMSYCTLDRYGGMITHYASMKSAEPAGTGKVWWPDYGPSQRDHSYQEKYMPANHIFDKVVKPHTTGRDRAPPQPERQPLQFRNPAPARQAMLMQDQPTNEARLAAKEKTNKQGAMRMMEMRQRQVDSWSEDVPIRMAAAKNPKGRALPRTGSEPALSSMACVQVTRETFEKLGFTVGRSKGSTADGFGGAEGSKRRHNPLGMHSLLFSGNVVEKPRASSHSSLPRKPTKQWRSLPESGFVFDPRTSLPVPRGGWNTQPPSSWPEPSVMGGREWSAPVTFDARPKASNAEAIEYAVAPSSYDRGVTAGSAGATIPKSPYGTVREPGQERQGLGPNALASTTGSFRNTAGSAGSPEPAAAVAQ